MMGFYDIPNEFAALNVSQRMRIQAADEVPRHGWTVTTLLGSDGRIDARSRSREELIILRAILRSLPQATVQRVKWDPQQVIADIDAELKRRDEH
jgi:hypothetical protein